MSEAMTPCPEDHPLMIAWKAWQKTPDYENSFKWLAHDQHRQGSMWAVFMAGFNSANARGLRPEAVKQVVDGIRSALNELGVPQPGYPAPVANAVKILTEALTNLEGK